nr:hypothetical protein [Tanacetum cinerariifolium]
MKASEEASQFPEQAPPSPDYVPRPEHPPSPDYVPGPEHPPSPDYVPGPEYPKYLVPLENPKTRSHAQVSPSLKSKSDSLGIDSGIEADTFEVLSEGIKEDGKYFCSAESSF